MDTIGSRLKAERKRLGINQTDFSAIAGVQKNAQSNYESDVRSPDAAYLAAVAKAGVDVAFVVTGVPSDSALTEDEVDLVRRYRGAPDVVKAVAIAALTAGAAPSSSKYQMNFGGATIGNQNVGDVNVKTRKVVGVEKKK
ncbi:helix-turn-helix domain-containing protein [Pandoraea commovens]|uniref:Helix-turn-helix domain-containing protein n=1 Tax=Pandoraea commovens TaxID=2508289 RepID=A0ABY5QI65_9BURK|nr:helix-turn-helix transcriptional regulator [Pandoraea commovens]UVA80501.1 helix-turn-helix domain-containing protein [Pandoraea commovens]